MLLNKVVIFKRVASMNSESLYLRPNKKVLPANWVLSSIEFILINICIDKNDHKTKSEQSLKMVHSYFRPTTLIISTNVRN